MDIVATFLVRVFCDRGLVRLCCDTLRTSGFVDDVTCARGSVWATRYGRIFMKHSRRKCNAPNVLEAKFASMVAEIRVCSLYASFQKVGCGS